MKISIVTISFNQREYLKASIESVLSQQGCALEYIVVDPGSTDGSRELINSYGDRIIKVFQPDLGPADGLNQGFKIASGDIYGFINSDDYLLPNALAAIRRFFDSARRDTFVSGVGFTQFPDGRRQLVRPSVLSKRSMLWRSAVIFQQATFFPAALFKGVGGFNVKNKTCWDYELYLKFLINGASHKLIDDELAVFRLHDQSISGTGRLNDLYQEELDGLFQKYVGRKRNWTDGLATTYLRTERELRRRMAQIIFPPKRST